MRQVVISVLFALFLGAPVHGQTPFGNPWEPPRIPPAPAQFVPPTPEHPSLAWARGILRCTGNPCVVHENHGGFVKVFDKAREVLEQHHVALLVNGLCSSACARTAALMLQRGHGCITARAVLGVHQQRDVWTGKSSDLSYGALDRAIAGRGGLPPPEEVDHLPFDVTRRILPVCGEQPRQRYADR